MVYYNLYGESRSEKEYTFFYYYLQGQSIPNHSPEWVVFRLSLFIDKEIKLYTPIFLSIYSPFVPKLTFLIFSLFKSYRYSSLPLVTIDYSSSLPLT